MLPDFDAVIERRNTHSSKWDGMATHTGVTAPDGLAMWTADMDFMAPEPVRQRLSAAVARGIFGYYGADATWRAAACGWTARRHGWTVEPDWISPSGGVCAALGVCCQAFSEPGDGVVIFAPVYHAFARMIRANRRVVIAAPLVETQGRYAMDLDALGENLPATARIVFLCSPHNPGGTVWTRDELKALADFCVARGLVLVSDEVWRDLVYPGARHTPTALAAPEASAALVTCAAPSKTFNLAGGKLSEVIIEDAALRARYRAAAAATNDMEMPLMGALAAEAAYDQGQPWLDALIPYLAANRDLFAAGLAVAAPGARVMDMAATYLAWTDFTGTGLPEADVARRLRDVARIGVSAGPSFGHGGEGRARFNLACPRSVVAQALERIADAFADLR